MGRSESTDGRHRGRMIKHKYSSDMSVNSSSSSNDSLLLYPEIHCFVTKSASFIFTTYCITNILLLLPLSILVFYVGLQRWRQKRSNSSTATSHSDSFTYHMVMVELIGVLGCIVSCCGIYRDQASTVFVGFYLWSFTWYGQMSFHVLTCVERYLAVVHPITYLTLRGERGIKIRNISIGFAWLLCFGGTSVITRGNVPFFLDSFLLAFSVIVISLCSVSVLRVLIRPKPGEQCRDRERADQSKLRAFYTITAILGVLLMRTFYSVVVIVSEYVRSENCRVSLTEAWFSVPSSLVLPLLFVNRAGIFACWKNKANEDNG